MATELEPTILDELTDAELATTLDLLELDEATDNELAVEDELKDDDIFEELLITLLEFFCDELELITTITEDAELDVFILAAELETAATAEEIELLLFSETLLAFCEKLLFCDELLATKTELLEAAVEFALETALLLTFGVGDGDDSPPLPPPHALSTSEKMAIHGAEKLE